MSSSSNEFNNSDRVQLVRSLLTEHGQDGWDRSWQQKNTPWDAGKPQPPLLEALRSPYLQLPEVGRALVPGCGRGYDAVQIASQLNYSTLGIDFAESAIEEALSNLRGASKQAARHVRFQKLDFFNFKVEEKDRFNLIYDYTFFCAIPPELRKEWGKQMTKLTAPYGYLIALVYPIDGHRDGGPPFSVSVDLYDDALGRNWEKIVDKQPEESFLNHIGRERLVIWHRTL